MDNFNGIVQLKEGKINFQSFCENIITIIVVDE